MNQGVDCPCCTRKTQKRGEIKAINQWLDDYDKHRDEDKTLAMDLILLRMAVWTLMRRLGVTSHVVSESTASLLPEGWQRNITVHPSTIGEGMVYEIPE